jgi:hypothetical protein
MNDESPGPVVDSIAAGSAPEDCSKLTVTVAGNLVRRFFYLVQMGFQIQLQVGCSITAVLTEQLGLSPSYVAERISTVFLDGRPVDHLDQAIVKDNAVLALSGALPGLVGATLRSGSPLACFRDGITHVPAADANHCAAGTITLKLFNILVPDLGPCFLERGILVQATEIQSFLSSQLQDFWEAHPHFRLNGQSIPAERFQQGPRPPLSDHVLLAVTSQTAN